MKTIVMEASVDQTDTPAREPGEFIMLIVRKTLDDVGHELPGGPQVVTMTVYNSEIFEGARKAKLTIELE